MSEWLCEDEPDLTIPEDVIVRAKVDDLQTETVPYTDKKTGEAKEFHKAVFWFEVTEQGKWVGRKIKGECNAKLSNHPNNRFRQWAEALLARDIPTGMQISRDDLIGMPCKITVTHFKGTKDPSRVFEQVDEVLPAGDFTDAPPF